MWNIELPGYLVLEPVLSFQYVSAFGPHIFIMIKILLWGRNKLMASVVYDTEIYYLPDHWGRLKPCSVHKYKTFDIVNVFFAITLQIYQSIIHQMVEKCIYQLRGRGKIKVILLLYVEIYFSNIILI